MAYIRHSWLARLIQALYIIGVCGACGVLIDLDHVLVLVVRGLPITWENLLTRAGRPLHLVAVLVSGGAFVALNALYIRFLLKEQG